jgi:putative colanic acid biosynthesis UDP-glucose lipid carrier transferase
MQKYYSKILFNFHLLNLLGLIIIFLGLCINKFGNITNITNEYLLLLLLAIAIFLILSFIIESPKKLQPPYKVVFYKFLYVYIIFSACIFTISFLLKDQAYSRKFIIMFLFTYLIYLGLIYFLLNYIYKKGKSNHRTNIMIIGAGLLAKKLFNIVSEKLSNSVNVVGVLHHNNEKCKCLNQHIIGTISDYNSIVQSQHIDEVYITIPMKYEDEIKEIIKISEYYGVKIRIIPNYFRLNNIKFHSYYLGKIPIINIRDLPLENPLNRALKRTFDIVMSIFVLIITSPIFLVVSILIKLTSKGPIFFNPIRVGLNRKQFKMYKFRSMYVTPPEICNTKSTEKNDPRITPIGKFIRKWNIDELPQFVNVLKGEMSVVGPRPHRVNLDEEFITEVYDYRIRQFVKPGITGWAQVNGFRGPTDTKNKKNARVKYDLYYIENWSIAFDIYIVLLTIFGKKSKKNAF